MLDISGLFRSELELSLGCTELAAIALSTSIAYNAIQGILPSWLGGMEPSGREAVEKRPLVDRIYVEVDHNTFKNSIAVPIPRTDGLHGVHLAAALGVYCDPERRLLLFSGVNTKKVEKARLLLKKGRVECKVIGTDRTKPCIEIVSKVEAGNHRGTARSLYKHCNIVRVERDERTLLQKPQENHRPGIGRDMSALSALHRNRPEEARSLTKLR